MKNVIDDRRFAVVVNGRDLVKSSIRQTQSGDIIIDDGRSFSVNSVLANKATIVNLSVTSLTASSVTAATGTFSTSVTTDTISEYTATHGVIIDGVTLKDGGATLTDITTINRDGTNSLVITGSSTNNIGMRLTNTSASARSWSIGTSGASGPGSAGALFFYDNTANANRAYFNSSGALIVGTDPGGSELVRVGGTMRCGKITGAAAVPGSFASLAAVQSFLASVFA